MTNLGISLEILHVYPSGHKIQFNIKSTLDQDRIKIDNYLSMLMQCSVPTGPCMGLTLEMMGVSSVFFSLIFLLKLVSISFLMTFSGGYVIGEFSSKTVLDHVRVKMGRANTHGIRGQGRKGVCKEHMYTCKVGQQSRVGDVDTDMGRCEIVMCSNILICINVLFS